MTNANGYRYNGAWAWVYRGLLACVAVLLTVVASLTLNTLNTLTESVSGMGAEIKAIRTELADLRENLAGNYITRDETRALIEAAETRLRRQIEREVPRR